MYMIRSKEKKEAIFRDGERVTGDGDSSCNPDGNLVGCAFCGSSGLGEGVRGASQARPHILGTYLHMDGLGDTKYYTQTCEAGVFFPGKRGKGRR